MLTHMEKNYLNYIHVVIGFTLALILCKDFVKELSTVIPMSTQ